MADTSTSMPYREARERAEAIRATLAPHCVQIGSERANGGTRADRPMKAECRRPKAWDQDMGSYRTLVQGQPRKPNGWHNSETYHGTNPVRLRDVGIGDGRRPRKAVPNGRSTKNNASFDEAMAVMPILRNKRSVWTVPTAAYSGAHFATFPPALIRPCILAGCPQGGTVLDPFAGTGTTGEVAEEEGRHSILIELNPAYVEMAKRRTAQGGLFCQAAGSAS